MQRLQLQRVNNFTTTTATTTTTTTTRTTTTKQLYIRGVAEILHWGPQKMSAEGARIEAPRGVGIGEGVSPPNRLGGLRERRELFQRGLRRSPGRQRIFGIFEVHRTLNTVPTKPVVFP